MRLTNVHGQEIGSAFVIAVDLSEIPDLAAKWRSSIASENKDQWALANPIVQIYGLFAIEGKYAHIRSVVADAQIAFMPLRQCVTKKAVNIARSAHEMSHHEIGGQ